MHFPAPWMGGLALLKTVSGIIGRLNQKEFWANNTKITAKKAFNLYGANIELIKHFLVWCRSIFLLLQF